MTTTDTGEGTPAGESAGESGEGKSTEKDWQAEAEKWRALARKHEDRAKANSSAADKLAELENASKSDLEKAQIAAHAAEERAKAAELRALRLEVAGAKGLSPAQAKRLSGSTMEELEADAEELLESFKPADTVDKGGKPREALKGGASDDDTTDEPSIAEVLKNIPRAS